MTEHDRGFSGERWIDYRAACAAASSPGLLLVPGVEYSDPANLVHVLVWGCSSFFGEGLSTSATLARVREEGGIAVLAHPSRLNAWRQYDPAWTQNFLGVEVWNRKTDGWAPSRSGGMIAPNESLLHFAGLDFHDQRQLFPLSMLVSAASEPNEEVIIEALRSRRASACVFGRELKNVLNPGAAFAFTAVEHIRRPLARTVRNVRRYLSLRRPKAADQTA